MAETAKELALSKLDGLLERTHRIETKVDGLRQETGLFDGWVPTQPALPPEPEETQMTVAWWKMRNPEKNYKAAAYRLEWFDGNFYIHQNHRGQNGTPEVVNVQKFQVRDGKLFGRAGSGQPWDIESTGWEYAGEVEFPQ